MEQLEIIELPQQGDADTTAVVEQSRQASQRGEADPLLSKVALPLRAVFYPLGFAVEISTNAQEVLDAAAQSWGHLRRCYPREMLRLRIGITDGGSADCPPAPVVRGQRHLLSMIADPQNQAICDLETGFAFAWLNHAALRHRDYLRYHFIEATALVLISALYVTPIHAACVSRHGRGMLLCGESGAGKSSLAYGCACAGWTFTSDDASYLLRDGGQPRVIGNSHQVRFRPSAQELFPELHGRSLTPRAEGKPSIEVPTSELSGLITSDEATVRYLIFLNRQPSAVAELLPLASSVALQRLSQDLYPADEVQQRQAAALEQLASTEVYELRYCELYRAIERLELLARGEDEPAL